MTKAYGVFTHVSSQTCEPWDDFSWIYCDQPLVDSLIDWLHGAESVWRN